MARLLLPAIVIYSLHRLFVQAPLVPQPLGAGQRIEQLGASRPVEKWMRCRLLIYPIWTFITVGEQPATHPLLSKIQPSAGPSSRAQNWDSSRTDSEFRGKCERFRRTLQSVNVPADYHETVVIRRGKIFEDTFENTIGFDMAEWKNKWSITFIGEPGEGIGVKREWYTALIRSTVDRNVQLFVPSDGDRDAYTINTHKSASDATLQRFRFIGRVIAKAVYDGQLVPMYFTRSMYKHILGKQVDCSDLAIEDPVYYRSLKYIWENDVGQIKKALKQSLKWTVEVLEGGKKVERELIPGGRKIKVTNDKRGEYVERVCEMKLHTVIEKQLGAFLTGFYEIIPKTIISIFDEREFELVISGPPVIDIDDWQENTVYAGYTAESPLIQWFWETLRSFNQRQLGQFLHYVTGSSKPPLRGFAYLDGNAQRFRKFAITSGNELKAIVCGFQLILPSYFETQADLEQVLLATIESFSHGFNDV